MEPFPTTGIRPKRRILLDGTILGSGSDSGEDLEMINPLKSNTPKAIEGKLSSSAQPSEISQTQMLADMMKKQNAVISDLSHKVDQLQISQKIR